jgi:hypothetical protein
MDSPFPRPPALEERLLRNGVDALEADRNRCLDCGRTPLIGEHVHLYESADLVCELCRMIRRDAPVLSAQVTHRLGSADRSDPAVVVRVSRC